MQLYSIQQITHGIMLVGPVGTGKSLLSGAVLEATCSTSSAHKIEAPVGTRKPKPCLNLVSTLSQTCLNLSTLNSVSTFVSTLNPVSTLSQPFVSIELKLAAQVERERESK